MTHPHPVTAILQEGVAEGVFPGAVLYVRRSGAVVCHQAVGRATYTADAPAVTTATLYDLASLTKPLATTTAVLRLVQEGGIALAQPVGAVLDELRAAPVGRATIEQLLAHAAGLPAWRPYYERMGRETEPDGSPVGRVRAVRLVLDWIAAEPLEGPPGRQSLYSDLGFLLLGFLVERVAAASLAAWCRASLWEPGIPRSLDFIDAPNDSDAVFGREALIAPTEVDPWRGRLLCGEVHDENAWALGGVAGHAGLFGTAEAVGLAAQWWLEAWIAAGGKRDASLIRRFTSRATWVPGTSRALGWDTPSAPSSSGEFFSPQSFGHLGFTGTSLWIDPIRELVVVLVSNRVHPTRANDRIKAFRPRLHDAVWQTWGRRREGQSA